MGEIGKALNEVLSKYHNVQTKDTEEKECPGTEVLHICYPHTQKFLPLTDSYIEKYKPQLVFIHTTTPVGTTQTVAISLRQLSSPCYVVHAPIRGQHDNLAKGIQDYTMMVGGGYALAVSKACEYLNLANIKTYPVIPSSVSELAKLLSLTQYGVNIEFARYAHKCCKHFDIPYQAIKDYTKSYNDMLTQVIGKDGENHKKFNLDSPVGKIGGHCVLPAMEKINTQVPEKFITELLEVNNGFVR